MVNSKAKGAAFERRICKQLSLWISDGMRDDLLWRSAMSGGRATLQVKNLPNKKRYNQCGDISAISREGQDFLEVFFVDCKFLNSLKIDAWIYGSEGCLPNMWDKVLLEAKTHNRVPLVVAKQNNKPELILTNFAGFLHFRGASAFADEMHLLFPWRARFWRHEKEVYVLLFQDLLVRIRWERMRLNFENAGLIPPAPKKRQRVTF